MKRFIIHSIMLGLCACAQAQVPARNVSAPLQQALADPTRSAEHRQSDAARLPVETMAFFGLREDMRVLDINPGSGYYVPLLASALKARGEFMIGVGTDHMESSLLKQPGYEHVKVVSKKTTLNRPEGARHYVLGELDFNLKPVDMVTNFRTYHIFDLNDRNKLNRAIYEVLRPGGIYAVIDHTARHGEPETEANRRRFDSVKAIAEIQAAGFVLQDYSTLHYQQQDDLSLEVGDPKVAGQTDRWALKFIKPEK